MDVIFNTSLGVIFGVRKYADALWNVVKGRGIAVNLKHELVQVRPAKREAVFRLLGSTADPKETVTFKVSIRSAHPSEKSSILAAYVPRQNLLTFCVLTAESTVYAKQCASSRGKKKMSGIVLQRG